MMHFDIDELTVLEVFDCDSRQECLDSMRQALPELELDREMFDLVVSVIGKVEDMTDREYRELDRTEAVYDDFDMYVDSNYDDKYAFIEGEPELHSPIDFMWMDPDFSSVISAAEM